jgi:hypothetical protein
MASYTFTITDDRLNHAVLRGRHLDSDDITETATWQAVPVPTLPGGIGVVCIDLPAGAPAIRVAITAAALVAEPVTGYRIEPGQSVTLGIGTGDVINVRTA